MAGVIQGGKDICPETFDKLAFRKPYLCAAQGFIHRVIQGVHPTRINLNEEDSGKMRRILQSTLGSRQQRFHYSIGIQLLGTSAEHRQSNGPDRQPLSIEYP